MVAAKLCQIDPKSKLMFCESVNCMESPRGATPSHTIELCHEKMYLKVFVIVIPKEGLAGWGPANPSFGKTPTTGYNL